MTEITCEGCGACCMRMYAPPGYSAVDYGACWPEDSGDYELWEATPEEAKQIARERWEIEDVEQPCCWLDLETRKCRFYEHRPSICRDYEPGEDCLPVRRLYQINLEVGEDHGN